MPYSKKLGDFWEVKPPAWLEEIYPAEKDRIGVLVTSGYFAEIEKQLRKMGIEENLVFISDRIYQGNDERLAW